MQKKTGGILMRISSLPGDFESGTMGDEARKFVDNIAEMGFSYWQILSINPTIEGFSPNNCVSLFAGNPNLIEPSYLVSEGLLTVEEVNNSKKGNNYLGDMHLNSAVFGRRRLILLRKAFSRLNGKMMNEVRAFAVKNKSWLYDYALFMILKNEYGDMNWNKWPAFGLRLHKDEAIRLKVIEKDNDMMFWAYVQYEFFKQYNELKKYANDRGVSIIGDVTLYSHYDSSDVWANRGFYDINSKLVPKRIAGAPVDRFNRNGSLWGNPLYNWDVMKKDGYKWWIKRLEQAFELYDMIRINQFQSLFNYWVVPYQNRTAKKGMWEKGPGFDFIEKIKDAFQKTPIIVDDSWNTDEESKGLLKKLLKEEGYRDLRVMQLGFEAEDNSENARHLPENYNENCVAYVGARENDTIIDWFNNASQENRECSLENCGCVISAKSGESRDMVMLSDIRSANDSYAADDTYAADDEYTEGDTHAAGDEYTEDDENATDDTYAADDQHTEVDEYDTDDTRVSDGTYKVDDVHTAREIIVAWIETLWKSNALLTIVPIQDLCVVSYETRAKKIGAVKIAEIEAKLNAESVNNADFTSNRAKNEKNDSINKTDRKSAAGIRKNANIGAGTDAESWIFRITKEKLESIDSKWMRELNEKTGRAEPQVPNRQNEAAYG